MGQSNEGVYFISDGSAVKIGTVLAGEERDNSWVGYETEFYEAVERRRKQLQIGSSRELRVINAHPYLVESEVHARLQKFRKRGEWFTRAAIPHIKELCVGALGQTDYRAAAEARWPETHIVSNGPYASLAYCRRPDDHKSGPKSALLHLSLEAANAAVEHINTHGCGSFCTGQHETAVVDQGGLTAYPGSNARGRSGTSSPGAEQLVLTYL